MTDIAMTVAFVLILVPATIMLAGYLRSVDWNRPDNPGGRAMVTLLAVVCGSSALSTIALLLPEWAGEDRAKWVRVIIRLVFAGAMWNLLRVFRRARREGTSGADGHPHDRRRRGDDPVGIDRHAGGGHVGAPDDL
jgi:hypothetical protein